MNVIVQQLYRKSWSNFKIKVESLIESKNNAEQLVTELNSKKGWRERVASAKIIATFNLNKDIPCLINTFLEVPEYNTCCAFTTMVKEVLGIEGVEYLIQMRNSCKKNECGNTMLNVINTSIKELQNI